MADSSGFMLSFYLYPDKDDISQNTSCSSLQKSAQFVAKLGEAVTRNIEHKLFFDNLFTRLCLIYYLDKEGIL